MNKFKWGPFFWYFIHRISSYKSEYKSKSGIHFLGKECEENRVNNIKKFYYLLPFLIPCSKCRVCTIMYYEKDDYSDCESLEDLLRWSFRFHNSINMKKNKKVHFYGILGKYSGRTNHNMIYTFISILWISKKKYAKFSDNDSKEYKINRDIYNCHIEFFKLLPSIFPCSMCKENLSLIKNEINSYSISLLMNCHFPDNKSSTTYHDNALSFKNLNFDNSELMKQNDDYEQLNKPACEIKKKSFQSYSFRLFRTNSKKPEKRNYLRICRKIPVLPNIKYKMRVFLSSNKKMILSMSYNKKSILFSINKKEYEKFEFTGSVESIFSLPFKNNNIDNIEMGGILRLKFKLNSDDNEKNIIKSIKIFTVKN